MAPPAFTIAHEADAPVADDELVGLLTRVYVGGGFTDPAAAPTVLTPAAVRARGRLLVARAEGRLAGTIILVAPGDPGRRLAAADEAELHLLAVAPELRGRGVGAALVTAGVAAARAAGCARVVLWTQPTMHEAQRLYARAGFVRAPARDFTTGPRSYLVLEMALV